RVSEPLLPLVLAAVHELTGRPLVCVLPEDADARDAADAASWFVGEDLVALLPSRGVGFGSGLDPPPHLVGERFRGLEVLARGGLVCASAAAIAERLPPLEARPEPVRLAPGDEPGCEEPAKELDLGGAAELTDLPMGQPYAFEAQRPALTARGLAEAENELGAFLRAGQRVVVAFPHRGDALRTQNLLRKVAPSLLEPGGRLSEEAEPVFAVAP